MKYGNKFEKLANAINESSSYRVNANGQELIKKYHSIINSLEQELLGIQTLKSITRDPATTAQQSAIQIISSVNSNQTGSEEFDLMSRLDTMTNGGKSDIQGSSIAFNQDDKILYYLDEV